MKKQLLTTSISALTASLVLSAASGAQSLDYTAMSELFGEPVTAGATGAPQRASDVPATMVIITRDDIERFPEYDIPGILRHYAGVNFNRFGVGDGQVSIRGAATPYTPRLLVLVNGREVYLDSYGYTAWSALPVQLEEIQQIEVVKGAQSALYGFNAVAGVVNIITRNPQHENYTNFRVNTGTDGYSDAAFTAAHSVGDRAAFRLSYGRMESDEFDAYAPNTTAAMFADAGFSRENTAVEGRFQLTDKVSLRAEATYSTIEQAELTAAFTTTRTAYEVSSYKADLEADTSLGFVTVSAFTTNAEMVYDFGPISTELSVLRVQDLFKFGTNDTIRLSAELRSGESISFPDPGNGDFGYDSYALSAMWNHKFSNAVDLTLAGRYDSVDWSRDGTPDPIFYVFDQEDYSVSFEEFSYNAALVWRPDFGGSVRVMAGRGIQAPTIFDIGFTLVAAAGPVPIVIAGDPGMVPSVVTNYEIAYDRALSPTMTARAAVFHNDTQDVRGVFGTVPDLLPPAVTAPTLLFGNRGETVLTGAEFTLSGDPEGAFDWDVSYTFQSVSDDLAPFPFYTVQDFEGMTPEHMLNAHLGWTGDRLTVDAFANYVSDTTSPMQSNFGGVTVEEIDAHLAASFRVGYRFNDHVGVSFNAQNATYGDGETTNVNFQPASRMWLQLVAGF